MIEILIPTLEARAAQFEYIHAKLLSQIGDLPINVRWLRDNGQNSTGFKRNALLQSSDADYTCFLDDDDDISDKYIKYLWDAANSGVDCASLTGIITFDGKGAKQFVHSIQYDRYFEDQHVYYRPPNHLNLIKRSIAQEFEFPDVTLSEDTPWAMQICNAKVLKTEFAIPEVIYYYKYVTK
jgi:hypothetical protein